jgi:hypothetical protein
MNQGQGWPSHETAYAPGLRHLHSPLFAQGMTHAPGGLHGSLPKNRTGNKGSKGKRKNDRATSLPRYLASANMIKWEPLRSDEQQFGLCLRC